LHGREVRAVFYQFITLSDMSMMFKNITKSATPSPRLQSQCAAGHTPFHT